MIKEIEAKVLLSHVKQPDVWFGLKYNMNLYRGCQHQCIYCDSRSECYGIENFRDVLVKSNAVELLGSELSRKRVRGTIGFGAMSDTYMPLEKEFKLTQKSLKVISEFRFPVHIITKSSLVLRDIELLKKISDVYAAVSFSITAADDALGRRVEPNASPVSERFFALSELSKRGIYSGIVLMPVLPFIEDNWNNIRSIVEKAHASGAHYIIPAFGMTLRDRQRNYYYDKLDESFPGIRKKYEERYGNQYCCDAVNAQKLTTKFSVLCDRLSIDRRIKVYDLSRGRQLSLFDDQ